MPKQDLGSFWGLMADLWSGLSPVMRVFGFGGLALGVGVGLWATGQVSSDGVRGVRHVLAWVLITCTVVGAVLGLALGSLIELLWKAAKPQKRRKPRLRK